ncbi:MAG: helix-turn-helix transcriptional regulator [Clostridia bacterium]|nr:helix-turn-helix transcriptional regulator [Clostridia bacterium]
MTFGEKLTNLRKQNNYTQEQLADILEVSRQSVSKWESDIAYPETEKLIRLGKLFDCSMDYLLCDDCTDKSGKSADTVTSVLKNIHSTLKKQCRERKSEKMLCGMPLYHIGRDARAFFAIGIRARGVFAVGLRAHGIFSLGLLSCGIVSVGLLSLGLIALGCFSLGLMSVGSISLGLISIGAIAVGIVSCGALSVGGFSFGALAIGKYFALGDNARAMIAVGKTDAVGKLFTAHALTDLNRAEILRLLDENVPPLLGWAKAISAMFI